MSTLGRRKPFSGFARKSTIFSNHDDNYFKVGDHLAKAFSVGKKFHK